MLILTAAAHNVQAHHLVPVHELNCSRDFPCPPELQRRIDFWVEVFKTWGKNTAIFHHTDVPHRVYSVIESGRGCRSSKTVNNERKRIKTDLYNVAEKIKSGADLNEQERHYAELFDSGKPGDMLHAANKIRCQDGVKDSYLGGLKRFNQYSYMVDTVLAQYDLHPDIRYLPFVESSYNPAAYSKAGAAGMWQIMPRTARTLGMELNATIDERLDPEAATHGAARYLVNARRSLTKLARSIDPTIGDEQISPFVITSYNYGVNGMRRAIRRVQPDYLSVLQKYKSPAFQVAVKNFYSSFLAARHVTINAEKYFGAATLPQKIEVDTVALQHPASMERIKNVFKVSEQEIRPINPGLTRFIWHGWRMIPAGYQLRLPQRPSGYVEDIARLHAMEPETETLGQDYVVRRGDTACGIARALAVNCRELIRMNNLGRQALIRIGQKLAIPKRLVATQEPSSRGPDKTVVKPQSAEVLTHKVRSGESACEIASRYRVSCRQLISANRLNRKATIQVGQTLKIPGASSKQTVDLDENNQYLVRSGDNACTIASRFGVNCSELIAINHLSKKAVIFPGQKLKIPGLVVPDTSKTAAQLANVDAVIEQAQNPQPQSTQAQSTAADVGDADEADDADDAVSKDSNPGLTNLLDTLPHLDVVVSNSAGTPIYRVWVEADETIGHYADWLGLGGTRKIRQLNEISSAVSLRTGQYIKLPVDSAEQVESFEKKRMEYHQVLSEELKSHYRLTGIKKYKVQSGDSIWLLSNQSGFPVWLFYRLNPVFKNASLRTGQSVLLPVLEEY